MITFLFPGQGSQREHMYEMFREHETITNMVFEAASEASGIDVKMLCQKANIEILTKTENAQLVISAVNCALWKILETSGVYPDIVAGHSLGQYSAMICSGTLTLYDGFKLIYRRAHAMGTVRRKGMLCAVIGCKLETIMKICEHVSDNNGIVSIAIINSNNQVVIGGDIKYVERAIFEIEKTGFVKAQVLNVSNAFHTEVMKEVEEELSEFIDTLEFHEPKCKMLLNCKGDYANDVEEIRNDVKLQSCHTVLWSSCMQILTKMPNVLAAEVGMGSVLCSLLKRHNRNAHSYSISNEVARQNFISLAKRM